MFVSQVVFSVKCHFPERHFVNTGMTTSQHVSFIQCVGQLSFSQMVICSKNISWQTFGPHKYDSTQLVNYSPFIKRVGQMSVSQVVFSAKYHFPDRHLVNTGMTTSQHVSFIQCVGQMSFSQIVFLVIYNFPIRHLVNTSMTQHNRSTTLPLYSMLAKCHIAKKVIWSKNIFPTDIWPSCSKYDCIIIGHKIIVQKSPIM